MMNRQYYLYRFELIYGLLNFRWWKYKSVDEAGIILQNRLCKAAETSSNVAETNNFEDAERRTKRKKMNGNAESIMKTWRTENGEEIFQSETNSVGKNLY